MLTGSNNYSGDTIVVAGTLIIPTRFTLVDGANLDVGSGLAAFPLPDLPVPEAPGASPVPEPEAMSLLAVALAAGGFAFGRGLLSRISRRHDCG